MRFGNWIFRSYKSFTQWTWSWVFGVWWLWRTISSKKSTKVRKFEIFHINSSFDWVKNWNFMSSKIITKSSFWPRIFNTMIFLSVPCLLAIFIISFKLDYIVNRNAERFAASNAINVMPNLWHRTHWTRIILFIRATSRISANSVAIVFWVEDNWKYMKGLSHQSLSIIWCRSSILTWN